MPIEFTRERWQEIEENYRLWWEGKLQDDRESLVIMKTPKRLVRRLMRRIAELHPYEVPEILSIHIDDVDEGYRKWLLASVRAKP